MKFPAALLALAAFITPALAGDKPFKVAWTPYPSWQVLPAANLNISGQGPDLAKRSAEAGAKVEVVKFKEYVTSITALVAGDMDACTMTLQEALSFPVDSGIPVTVVLVNDYSNGNDAIFGPKGSKLEDLKGKPVLLEEFSVSQFLLYQALKSKGINPKEVQVRNTPGDEVPKIFLTSKTKPFAVTWNPHVVRVKESGEAAVLFSSDKIPHQIVDAIVVRTDRIKGNEAAIQALVNAYFDTLDRWEQGKHERTTRAIAATADLKSKEEIELFKKTVSTTAFHWTPAEVAGVMDGDEVKTNLNTVRSALIEFNAFKGQHPENYTVTFDSKWVKAAASRKK